MVGGVGVWARWARWARRLGVEGRLMGLHYELSPEG